MNKTFEPLDYCRVKKIFDKGFGFLSSLYYQGNVFFHFSRIKDAETKEKLENLKRGEVYIFFTSKEQDGKRKVNQLWLSLKNVDRRLIKDFVAKITEEMNLGNRNPFELAAVIRMLREHDFIDRESFQQIVSSNKILRTPTALKFLFTDNELSILEQRLENPAKVVLSTKLKEEIISLVH